MSETKFKEKVISDLLKLENIWVLKTQERTVRGIPDIIICLGGHFVAIELKDTGKKPDPLQEYRIKQIKNAKGFAFATTPEDWDMHFRLIVERFSSC